MVAVAGVLPVLSQILDAGSSGIVIQPAWATVALAIAAALIVLDRFFGFSSAWARYMVTGQAITEALNQFRLNWQLAASKSSANELTQDSFDELLGLAKALTMEKDRLVKVETLQWVKEFGESLAEMDRSASEEGKK
jgi:hypothetical protein